MARCVYDALNTCLDFDKTLAEKSFTIKPVSSVVAMGPLLFVPTLLLINLKFVILTYNYNYNYNYNLNYNYNYNLNCDQSFEFPEIAGYSITIQTPSYPNSYENYETCWWALLVPAGLELRKDF